MGTNLNVDKLYTLYAVTSRNSDRIYFGITCSPLSNRLASHRKPSSNAKSKIASWMRRHGRSSEIRAIVSGLSCEEACCLEADLVDAAKLSIPKLCLNTAAGGNAGPIGCVRSEETRAKIRDANLGKVCPESTRQKLRDRHLGVKKTASHAAAISAGKKKLYESAAARQAMVVSQKTRKTVSFVDLHTGFVIDFDSMNSAAKHLKTHRSAIYRSVNFGGVINKRYVLVQC